MKRLLISLPPYKISPLGDSALVIDFGNVIDADINRVVHSLFFQLKEDNVDGITEIVPAYSSLTIYYNVLSIIRKTPTTAFEWVCSTVNDLFLNFRLNSEENLRSIRIPVCYEGEFATDLEFLSKQKSLSIADIIQLHTSGRYRVYMLGFLPGFAYMGMVDEKISCERKPQPVNVEAGSVGIAGRQTGIYPMRSPGGWQVIGRTPLKLFDQNKKEPVLLEAGDMIEFYSISKDEFEDIKSRNA